MTSLSLSLACRSRRHFSLQQTGVVAVYGHRHEYNNNIHDVYAWYHTLQEALLPRRAQRVRRA